MDTLWSITDYLMDFNKVRRFQELCGLQPKKGLQIRTALENNKKNYNKTNKLYAESKISDQEFYDDIDGRKTPADFGTDTITSDSDYCTQSSCDDVRGCVYNDNDEAKVESQNYQVNNWFLYYLFRFGSALGHEAFYITFLPYIFWNIDPFVARKMIVVWVVTMYIGQALKDLIQWPRPTWPPVFKLEKRVDAEYGVPSTHAIAGTALPFSFLMALYGRHEFSLELGVTLACSWCLLVVLSRLYLGMHSILDVICGVLIAGIYLWLGWPFMDMVEEYTIKSRFAPLIIVLSHFLLGVFYPSTEHYSTTRGDTVVILACGAGIHCASNFVYQYGIDFEPNGERPFPLIPGDLSCLGINIARFVAGVAMLLVTRAVVKTLSLSLICHVLGVSKRDRQARQRKDVEVPYKFATYLAVGFVTVAIAPGVFDRLGLVYWPREQLDNLMKVSVVR